MDSLGTVKKCTHATGLKMISDHVFAEAWLTFAVCDNRDEQASYFYHCVFLGEDDKDL